MSSFGLIYEKRRMLGSFAIRFVGNGLTIRRAFLRFRCKADETPSTDITEHFLLVLVQAGLWRNAVLLYGMEDGRVAWPWR
jgi:hypothetical protein